MKENTIENIKPKGRKKKRILLKVIYGLIILFLTIDVFLYFFATPLLKNYLQEKVKQESKGLFSINFEKISIEIGFRMLSLEKFEMISDSTVYEKLIKNKKTKAALYNIKCSSIQLKGTNIYRLFSKKELKIKELILKAPVIELKKLPKKQINSKKRDFVHQDLYPAISPYLKQIEIKTIKLENGKFNLNINKDSSKITNHVGNVYIKLKNFLLNQEKFIKKEKLFYADDINIVIDNYKLKLSDNIHYLYANNINLSTEKSLLRVETVKINPINNKKQHLDTINHNYYRLNTSFIELKNFDIYKLYFDKNIKIQELIVENPKIYLINKYKKNEKNTIKQTTKEIDIYQLIKDKFNSITIDSLKINRSVFNYYYNSDIENKPSYKAKNLNLKFYNFVLNKHAKDDKSKIFYSNNINFSLKSFSALLPNNIHRLDVENIVANTQKKELYASNIRFVRKKRNLKIRTKNKSLFNINISSLKLQGIDYENFYHTRNIYLQQVNFKNSNLKAIIYKKENTKEKTVIEDLFSGFVKSIFINKFNIEKSKFNLKTVKNDSVFEEYKGKLIFNLHKFNINKYKKKSKLFFADGFKLQLFDYDQDFMNNTHKLNLKNVTISSIDSVVYIAKLSLKPKDDSITYQNLEKNYISNVYDFTIQNSKITGIDINKAATDSILNINNIYINKTKFVYFKYIDIKDRPDSLIYKNISIIDSETINNKNDSSKFKGNLNNLLSKFYTNVNIKKIDFKNSNFKFLEIDSNLNIDVVMSGKITARLKKFKFDTNPILLKNKFSYSDNFQFAINDFQKLISKKNYELKIDRLVFSSKDSILTAKVITLFPKKKIYSNKKIKNVFTIYCPYIATRRTNISEFINSNILDIGRLTIRNPAIAIFNKNLENKNEHKNDQENVIAYKFPFENLKFDKIKVKNGVFGILKNKNNFNKLAINTKFNLEINNLDIDSVKLKNPELLFKNLDVIAQFNNLHYQMADSVHFISTKQININTLKSKFSGEKVLYHNIEANNIIRNIEKNHIDTIKIPAFSIFGLKLDKLFINKALIIDSLKIKNPYIQVADFKQNSNNLSKLNLYNKIKHIFNAINISEIEVDSAKLELTANTKTRKFGNVFKNIFLKISNLIIDDLHQKRNNKIFNADDISMKITDYSINLGKDNLYNIKFKELGISTALKTLYIDLLELNPNIKRNVFAEKEKKEFTFNYLYGKKIIANNIDFQSFINEKKIIVENINLYNYNLHAYKHKKYPLDSVEKIALPLDYIKKIKNYLLIDTINISKSNIKFEMLQKNTIKSGIIDLADIEGQMINITNDKEKTVNSESTILKATAYLMKKSLISMIFNFPLNSIYGEYSYAGTIDSLDLKHANPFIKHVSSVILKSGYLNDAEFIVDANEKYALGKIKLDYNNLKVKIIKNKIKKNKEKTNKRGLVSLIANSIIKSSNPKFKAGKAKEKRIYFERNIFKPIFHYWTQSVLAGAKNTLGFKSKDFKERLKFERHNEKLRKENKNKINKTKYRDKKKLIEKVKKLENNRKIKDKERTIRDNLLN